MNDLFPNVPPSGRPSFDDVVQAVRDLHEATAGNNLPPTLAILQRKLEQNWQPDASVLLQAGSVTDASLRARTVRGAVTAAGVLARGSGFSVVRNSAGNYTITYAPAFASTPIVTYGLGGTASIANLATTAESATAFTVQAFTIAGAAADAAFSFHATSVEG